MNKIDGITENLRFMIHEVTAQVEQTRRFFVQPQWELVEKINNRDDYIDTLKSLIEEKTFGLLAAGQNLGKRDSDLLRAQNTISSNLERMGDFSVNIINQTRHLTQVDYLDNFDYAAFFREIKQALSRIQPALERRDISLAFGICQAEFRLDELYEKDFKRVLEDLGQGGHAGNLVTALFILHYLERMGDALLNIGEAVIFAIFGEKMKIHQYQALSETLSASGLSSSMAELEFESIWGTRSGCRIGRVREKNGDEKKDRPVLFKQGNLEKLRKEKENLEHWERLSPGLPPRVRAFMEGGDGDGAMITEFIPGCTFQDLAVMGQETVMWDTLFFIEETLSHVWSFTRQSRPARAGFARQMLGRRESVFDVHPHFDHAGSFINGLRLPSFTNLMEEAERLDQELAAPFSCLIHGDFNANNILYEPDRERIHFIDLHRSGLADYVQDVSVFLVSVYRLPVFERAVRLRLNEIIGRFFAFAQAHAAENGDQTFEARLAAGLARSFFTSTRFELNPKFAKRMFMTSSYLLRLLLENQDPWEEFRLPTQALAY